MNIRRGHGHQGEVTPVWLQDTGDTLGRTTINSAATGT